jgi:hypothetical protein
MTLEDFAFWSENAYWVFNQQLMAGQVSGQMSALGALGAGMKK